MNIKRMVSVLFCIAVSAGMIGLTEIHASGDVAINATNFPDQKFREYVKSFDTNNDGSLSTEEFNAVHTINVDSMSISDLTGIGYFTSLHNLLCNFNPITSFDLSQNTQLVTLDCGSDQLTSLNLTRNLMLEDVICEHNQLKSLDVSKNILLKKLYCGYDQLGEIDVTNNTALVELECNGNQLTSLDVRKNILLNSLSCYNNQLSSLDLTKNSSLTK